MSPWVRRRKIGAVGTAATSVALSLVVLTACGGGDGSDRQLSGPTVSAAGVTLTMPEGWAFLDNDDRGLVVAEMESDLTATAPQGPRLIVEPGSTDLLDPEALVSAMAGTNADATRIEIRKPPDPTPIGLEVGTEIELLEDDGASRVVRRYIIVNPGGADVFQFVLEAPPERWDGRVGTLEAILFTVDFDGPAAAAPTGTVAILPSPEPTSSAEEGYDTPEEAIYADSGFGSSQIRECSSQEPDTTYPCHHFWGEDGGGGLIYQYATDAGFSWWVLVAEQADGSFVVEDIEFDVAEIEHAGEPPF